jgi:hypothetical protein
MMKTTETREHNRYTGQDLVCDILMGACLIGAAFGLLELVGSF